MSKLKRKIMQHEQTKEKDMKRGSLNNSNKLHRQSKGTQVPLHQGMSRNACSSESGENS